MTPERIPLHASILVVDDEEVVCRSCQRILGGDGHSVRTTRDPQEGLRIAEETNPDIAILDLKMPGMDGLELLRRMKQSCPWTEVMIITGYAQIQSAVEAIKLGAFDYVPKPFSPDQLIVAVAKALERRRLESENQNLRMELRERYSFESMVGGSAKMREVYHLIERVAPTQSTVLIRGDSGTGKELIARAIHFTSPRAAERFVPVDCGALSETVLESEMFGHVKGAFTGAVAARKGFFEFAHGGTLFLDEIGNVAWNVQTRLLRVLQEREFKPVGATEPMRTDIRLIAATNRDLETMVAAGEFREELYYRLNIFTIRVPPLRERREDVPALAVHFMKKHRPETGSAVTTISPEALNALVQHDWPGNVRELENAIQRALVLAPGAVLLPEHLPARCGGGKPRAGAPVPRTWVELQHAKRELRERSEAELECAFLLAALTRTEGNATRAAEDVGLLRPNFQALLRKHGLKRESLTASEEAPATHEES